VLTKIRLSLGAVCAVLLAGLVVPAAALAGDLDQQQLIQNGFRGIASSQSGAQGFTAGRTGLLDQVDLDLQKSNSPPVLTVELRDISAGIPGNQVLATGTVQAASVPTSVGFVPVVFPTPAQVVTGNQYAIVISTAASGSNSYLWADKGPDVYAGGIESLDSPPGSGWLAQPNYDFAFKTYVAPPSSAPALTGQRAAALKKCKKKKTKQARKRCRNRAKKLPL
jgi:hypothetical protein